MKAGRVRINVKDGGLCITQNAELDIETEVVVYAKNPRNYIAKVSWERVSVKNGGRCTIQNVKRDTKTWDVASANHTVVLE